MEIKFEEQWNEELEEEIRMNVWDAAETYKGAVRILFGEVMSYSIDGCLPSWKEFEGNFVSQEISIIMIALRKTNQGRHISIHLNGEEALNDWFYRLCHVDYTPDWEKELKFVSFSGKTSAVYFRSHAPGKKALYL